MQISAQGAADGGDYLVNIFPIILGLSVATVPYHTSVRSVVDIVCSGLRCATDWCHGLQILQAMQPPTYIAHILFYSGYPRLWTGEFGVCWQLLASRRVLEYYREVVQWFEGVSWIDVCWQTPERRHWLDTRQQPAVTTNKIPHSLRYMHTCAQVQIENRSENEFDTN